MWYAVLNDLIGGWSVGNADKPQSKYHYSYGGGTDRILADFIYDRETAELIANLLNQHEEAQFKLGEFLSEMHEDE